LTPEERKGALVGLLGRLRTNAGSRLPKRSGDEEEFVPKSVIAARAAAAESAAADLDAARIFSAGHPHPGALDAAVADFEKPRFAPDDVPLETDPPPTAIPGSTPGSLEEALRQAEQAEIDRIEAEAAEARRVEAAEARRVDSAPPTPRSEVAEEAPSIEMGDSSELELDLYDPFDEATATGDADEAEALVLESEPPPPVPPKLPPPRIPAQPPPAPAPPASCRRRPSRASSQLRAIRSRSSFRSTSRPRSSPKRPHASRRKTCGSSRTISSPP
jgi:hypothetical protein